MFLLIVAMCKGRWRRGMSFLRPQSQR